MADPDPAERGEVEAIKAIPVRHPGRWVAAGIILVLVAQFVHWLVTDSALQWGVVGHYLFDSQILTGVEQHHQAHRSSPWSWARCSASAWR